MPTAILVGIPASLRARIERHVGRRLEIRILAMKQDGGFRLEVPSGIAANLITDFADQSESYRDVMLLVLPYPAIPSEVSQVAEVLSELGAAVSKPSPNSEGCDGRVRWPARVHRMDKQFQDALCYAICEFIDYHFPSEERDDAADRAVVCNILRGLVVHSKMGPNNHSHEDDLWKTAQRNLRPGDRNKIVSPLLADGILDRKKNKSTGGTGWVYWVNDVEKAKALCPCLLPYFQ